MVCTCYGIHVFNDGVVELSTKYVKLDDVIAMMIGEGDLKGDQFLENNPDEIKHGSCCVCMTCGYWFDECVCIHNGTLDLIHKLQTIEVDDNE